MNQTSFLIVIVMSLFLLISTGAYAADIEAGRVAATQCAVCHGENGEGNGAPKSKISGMDVDVFKKLVQLMVNDNISYGKRLGDY